LAELSAFDRHERALLVAIARGAVAATARGASYALPPEAGRGRLAVPGACFVTLHAGGELRGCIGSIEARRALAADVAANARAAAREDGRFDPIAAAELARVEIHLSLLGPPVALDVASRAELLAALVPGVDGLVLEEAGRRATFLPAVWGQLGDCERFVAHLERKAGFAERSWSPARRAFRYAVESIAAGGALDVD
jgi:AmmeMemoRadiSam system protein A